MSRCMKKMKRHAHTRLIIHFRRKKKSLPKEKRNKTKFTQISISNAVLFEFTDF